MTLTLHLILDSFISTTNFKWFILHPIRVSPKMILTPESIVPDRTYTTMVSKNADRTPDEIEAEVKEELETGLPRLVNDLRWFQSYFFIFFPSQIPLRLVFPP